MLCEQCDPDPDPVQDLIDSIQGNTPTRNDESVDQIATSGHAVPLQPGIGGHDNGPFSGARPEYSFYRITADSRPAGEEPEGDALVVNLTVASAPDETGSGPHLIYAAVIESDGDPANDWVPQGVYDWDTYQSADRWYEVFYDPGSDPAWAMTVTQVDGNQGRAEVESHAVASVDGPNLTLEIPSAELPRGAASLYRTVSFAHDGAFSESDRGADVCGDNPTQPMKSFVEVDWSAAQ